MQNNQASLTALITAFVRAYHATHDSPPIFIDYLAGELFSPQELAFLKKNLAAALAVFDPAGATLQPDEATALKLVMHAQSIPLSRGRYTEDCLARLTSEGVRQYVILGAGLDTFAFRRPKAAAHLDVFEVDHPATQADKLQRLDRIGWERPPHLHFVSVDFTRDDLREALLASSYEAKRTSFFSWLGVSYYLPREAVFQLLRTVAAIAPAGSSIVFDYMVPDSLLSEEAAQSAQRLRGITARTGEPMVTSFDPATLGEDLRHLGFRLQEDLGPAEIQARYMAGRTDGYSAPENVHFARAVIA